MPSRFPVKTVFLLTAAGGVAYYAYTHFFGAPAGGPQGMGMGAASVSVAEVIVRPVQEWHQFSGRLVAVNEAEIRPQVAGRIDAVHFRNGGMVKKGESLFTIDPRPYRAAAESARATYAYASADYERAHMLYKEKAVPKRELDEKLSAFQQAKAALTRAELDLEYTSVRSPISGKAGRAEVTEGNLVQPGNPVLTSVVSIAPIYADFEVDEATFLRYVQAGAGKGAKPVPVQMGLATEEATPHEGRVESFDNRLNAASGTIRVRAVFDNKDASLVPGLFARIRLGSAEETEAVLITDRAVGTDQNKKFVMVVDAENKAQYREVMLGARVDNLRVVSSGLKPGEKIVVNGLQHARPGAPVTPEMVQMTDDSTQMTSEKPATTGSPETEKAPENQNAPEPAADTKE